MLAAIIGGGIVRSVIAGFLALNLAAFSLVHHINTIEENEGRYAARKEIDRINEEAGLPLIMVKYYVTEDGSMVVHNGK